MNMEEEVNYSTVVFSKFEDSKPKPEPAEEVVYSEIKKITETPSLSSPQPEEQGCAALVEEKSISHTTLYKRTTICLGLLCVLLLAGVVAVSVMNINQVSQYNGVLVRNVQQQNNTNCTWLQSMANVSQALETLIQNLTRDNRLLQELYTNESTALLRVKAEKAVLEKEKEELGVQRNQLNNILKNITRFSSFPVSSYCQNISGEFHCEPCMRNWIQNRSSCYYFSTETPWLSWENSWKSCINMGGDLVTIDNTEEQEFIRKHTAFYYDEHHGYWIGLYKKNDVWVWTSGASLKKEFWNYTLNPSDIKCAMTNPKFASQNTWMPQYCDMWNKWVCEMNALVWPEM